MHGVIAQEEKGEDRRGDAAMALKPVPKLSVV